MRFTEFGTRYPTVALVSLQKASHWRVCHTVVRPLIRWMPCRRERPKGPIRLRTCRGPGMIRLWQERLGVWSDELVIRATVILAKGEVTYCRRIHVYQIRDLNGILNRVVKQCYDSQKCPTTTYILLNQYAIYYYDFLETETFED